MPFVYSTSPETPGTSTATTTETDHLRLATGNSRVYILSHYVVGRANAGATISGIAFRWKRFATASTVGTTATPRPRDPNAPASTLTAATLPTAGATPLIQLVFGCGKAGPGGWVAPNIDAALALANGAGANGNADFFSICAEATQTFEWSIEHQE